MFFSAAIAAAFTVDHPVKALEIALTEIPVGCSLARDVHWALEVAPRISNYLEARAAVDEHFKGMSGVHTYINGHPHLAISNVLDRVTTLAQPGS